MAGVSNHFTGAAAEHLLASFLLSQGLEVYLPARGQARCDMLYMDQNDKTVKVQCKTATWSKAGDSLYEQCRLARDNRQSGYPSARGYSPEEIDEVWVLGTHLWRFPIKVVAGLTSLCLNTTHPKPQNRPKSYDPNGHIMVVGSFETPFFRH